MHGLSKKADDEPSKKADDEPGLYLNAKLELNNSEDNGYIRTRYIIANKDQELEKRELEGKSVLISNVS